MFRSYECKVNINSKASLGVRYINPKQKRSIQVIVNIFMMMTEIFLTPVVAQSYDHCVIILNGKNILS